MSDFAAEEPTRPEFHRHPSTRHDRVGFYSRTAGFMPFGNTPMPYFPGSARASRFGAGIALTLFLMFIVVIGARTARLRTTTHLLCSVVAVALRRGVAHLSHTARGGRLMVPLSLCRHPRNHRDEARHCARRGAQHDGIQPQEWR
jgi:hypothetical protein